MSEDEELDIRILRNIRNKGFPLDVQCALLIVLSLAACVGIAYLATHCIQNVTCEAKVFR